VTGGISEVSPTTNSVTSRLVTGVCHPAERVSDSEIGGVRKVKGGTGDVNPTTASSPGSGADRPRTPLER
jgi:hypothetical protein